MIGLLRRSNVVISKIFEGLDDIILILGFNMQYYMFIFFPPSQIYSQCNVYEAGHKKKTFEYYTEKVI